MWIKTLQGYKLPASCLHTVQMGRLSVFVFLLIMAVILFFFYKAENSTKVMLFALAFTKCPSTESCLGSSIGLQCNTDKKMSLVMIWFHIIQIFVLFIYYIY